MGKVIQWELCEELKFDYTNKWNMHNPVSIQENEMHKIFWDFDLHLDHLISARRPDLVIDNKKKKKKRQSAE